MRYILLALLLTACAVHNARGPAFNDAALKDYNIILYHSDDSGIPGASFGINMNGKTLCTLHHNGYIAIKQPGTVTLSDEELLGMNGPTRITLPPGKHYVRVDKPDNSLLAKLTFGSAGGDYTSKVMTFTEVDYVKEKPFIALTREDCRIPE